MGHLVFLILPGSVDAGDPLCILDNIAPARCCKIAAKPNASCWEQLPRIEGLREFHPGRCCTDELNTNSLHYTDTPSRGQVLQLLSPGNPGTVIVRGVPGLADVLVRAAPVWGDRDSWSNGTVAGEQCVVNDAASLYMCKVRAADVIVAEILIKVVRWVVRELARDLDQAGAPGGSELASLVFSHAAQGHLRHFEYLQADWTPRWGSLFPMHSDTFCISVQTHMTLGGAQFEDGTFMVDSTGHMHRVRLGPADLALWFGDAVQLLTGNAVRAARHMVLMHHTYRSRLAPSPAADDTGPRRVTMFHLYPHNRKAEALIAAATAAQPNTRQWRFWHEAFDKWRSLRSDIDLGLMGLE